MGESRQPVYGMPYTVRPALGRRLFVAIGASLVGLRRPRAGLPAQRPRAASDLFRTTEEIGRWVARLSTAACATDTARAAMSAHASARGGGKGPTLPLGALYLRGLTVMAEAPPEPVRLRPGEWYRTPRRGRIPRRCARHTAGAAMSSVRLAGPVSERCRALVDVVITVAEAQPRFGGAHRLRGTPRNTGGPLRREVLLSEGDLLDNLTPAAAGRAAAWPGHPL